MHNVQVQQRCNALLRRIEAWQQLQVLFMPRVNALREESTRHPYSPEDIPLLLPSQLSGKAACSRSLELIEFQLREGQAHDALNDLRQGLRSRAYILKFKNRFLRGQGSNTRARNALKTLDAKINVAATKYRVAHRSLTTLSASLGRVGWQDKLRPLLDEDIRSLTDASDLQPGEGRRRVSWIWRMCGYSDQATENEAEVGFQEGEWLLITTFLLTYPSSQPFVWNGARHAHAPTVGKRKSDYCSKNSSVHCDFWNGTQAGGWNGQVP